MNAQPGKLDFRTSSQIQQLGQRINAYFTIHEDQALQAITGIFRCRYAGVFGRVFRLLFLHDLHSPGQIMMTDCDRNTL